jgi:hypothetical protein
MRQRASLLASNGIQISDPEKQHTCGSCGNILVPGQGSTLTFQTDKKRKHREHRSASKASKAEEGNAQMEGQMERRGMSKIMTCKRCDRFTKLDFAAPRPVSRRKIVSGPQSWKQTQPEQPTKATPNASSKRRAKNRKAGLEALLADSKASRMARDARTLPTLAHFIKK